MVRYKEENGMLVLSRKEGQSIQVGDHVRLAVVRVKGNRVKIGIEAPEEVSIRRGELQGKWELDVEETELTNPAA